MTAASGAEAVLLRLASEQAVARGHRLLDPAAMEAAWEVAGVGRDDALDALRSLAAQKAVNLRLFGASIALLRLTEEGLGRYLETARPDLDDVRARVHDALRAEEGAGRLGEAVDLAAAVGEPSLVVEVVLEELRRGGNLVYNPVPGRRVRVHRVGPA